MSIREIALLGYDKRLTEYPKEIRVIVEDRLVDFMSATLLATRYSKQTALLETLYCYGGDNGAVSTLGSSKKLPLLSAVMFNSTLANSMAYEDGSRFAALHPASVIMPTALGLAESTGLPLHKVIPAIRFGYEVILKIGNILNPYCAEKGFHPTGVVAPLGAAATAGMLLNLNQEQLEHAFAIACSQGSGFIKAFSASDSQPLHVGQGTSMGLLAAFLAKKGVKGNTSILQTFCSAYGYPGEITGVGTFQNEICRTYIKYHGGCRHVHAPIDCMLKIMAEHNFTAQKIKSIEVEIYKLAVQMEIEDPKTGEDAKFSIPFAIALALTGGITLPDGFNDLKLSSPDIQEIMKLVSVKSSSLWNSVYPQKRGCTCKVVLQDGTVIKEDLDLPKGEPENPLSSNEINQKFYTLVSPLYGERVCQEVVRLIRDCSGRETSVRQLLSLIGGVGNEQKN